MRLFDILRTQDPRLEPEKCKVHLASWNGFEDPLAVYRAGEFDRWQSWQEKKNFERPFVVSLIKYQEGKSRWLYVGAYEQKGSKPHETKGVVYDLTPIESSLDLAGRVVSSFERPSRQAYLYGESVAPTCLVQEIRAEKLHNEEFPGFKNVNISFSELAAYARQGVPSWVAALRSVAGVYLISDQETGKLYVGSATGAEGIWSRWCGYLNGHGDNVRLRKLIADGGPQRAEHFHFSVLEVADTHTSPEEVLKREQHWKQVLLTRDHGHNGN